MINWKQYMLIAMIALIAIPSVSAFDFSNVIDYSNKDMTVNISNCNLWVGTCLIKGDGFGSLTLKSHEAVNIPRLVDAREKGAVMWYEADFSNGYENGLQGVNFYDMNDNGKQISKDYHYVILVQNGMKDESSQGKCSTTSLKNGSMQTECEDIISSVPNYIWEKLDTNNIPKGISTIGIAIDDLKEGESFDAVWTVAGKDIERHAIINVYDAHGKTLDDTGADNPAGSTDGYWFLLNKPQITIKEVVVDSRGLDTVCSIFNSTSSVIAMSTIASNNATFNTLLTSGQKYGIGCNGTGSHLVRAFTDCSLTSTINMTAMNVTEGLLTLSSGCSGRLNTYNWLSNVIGIRSTYDDGARAASTISVTLPSYPNNTIINSVPKTFYFNSTAGIDNLGNFTNATLYIYRNGALNLTNVTIISAPAPANTTVNSSQTLSFAGNYTWNYYYCGVNATLGTNCALAAKNNTVYIDLTAPIVSIVTPVQASYSISPPASTALNFTAFDSDFSINSCWYTMNNATNISIASCANTTIPLMAGLNNLTVFANDTAGNIGQANTFYYGKPTFQLCNNTVSTIALNFTFKDESTTLSMNATVPSSSFTYYLNSFDASTARTYTFFNLSHNYEYDFCIFPSYANLSSNFTFQFAHTDVTNYPTRTYTMNAFTLNNQTLNKTLYLLSSANGIYVSFLVINSQQLGIPNANILIQDSSNNVIESVYTDSSGSVSVWLNPSTSYKLTCTATGFAPFIESLTPSQTQYTIPLGALGGTNITSYTNGLQYFILPTSSLLNYNTTYAFSFNISSSTDIIQNFFLNISNGTNYFASAYSANNGGLVSTNLNTGDNSTLILYANWMINGNNFTITKFYTMANTSDYGYSILTAVNDLKAYKSSGFFGLNNFSMNLIIFVIIFALTGIMSYSFGLYSPAAVSGMVWVLTGLFDMGFGLITNPVNAVSYFPTIFTGIIFIALMYREVTSF